MKSYLLVHLCLFMLIYSITAETQYRRTPPFQKTENTTHLGDYTHSHENVEQLTFTCFPIGECQVCSPLEKKTMPYCKQFGNKEAVSCEWDDPELADKRNQTSFYDDDAISLPSFRACPRVRKVERMKFIKFEIEKPILQGINVAVAVISILIFTWRQRKIAREQYQKLAHRIGVIV